MSPVQVLPAHMKEVCGVKVSYTWKEHILTCHLEEWLDMNKQGLAKFSEQAGEAVNHSFKVRVWQHFKVPPGHARWDTQLVLGACTVTCTLTEN